MTPVSYCLLFGAVQQIVSQEFCPLDTLHNLKVNRAGQYLLLNPSPAAPHHSLLGELAELWSIFQIPLCKYLPLYTHTQRHVIFSYLRVCKISKNACSKQAQWRLRKKTFTVAAKHTQEHWETCAVPSLGQQPAIRQLPTWIFSFSSSPEFT